MSVILNRNETDMFLSMRSFINESKSSGDTIGDWFRSIWAYGVLTTGEYNNFVDFYNNNELEADKTPSNLQGTAPDNTHFGIGGMPSRPRPIHK